MGFIITIIVGAIIGWIAGMIMRTDANQGLLGDILVGIVGSALGRWLFGNVLQIGGALDAGSLSIVGILWGVIGAVVLLAIIKAIRRTA